MLLQSHESLICLRNTIYDILGEYECDCPTDWQFNEAMGTLFLCKENKNNDSIQQFISTALALSHFGEYPLDANCVLSSVSATPQGYTVFVKI